MLMLICYIFYRTPVPVAAVLVLNTPDDGRLTPETCRVTRRCDDLPATITHVPVAAILVLNTPDDGRLTTETC